LATFEALAYFPAAGTTDLPDTTILAALHRGQFVVLPEHLKQHYGPGPLYCTLEEALTRLAHALGDEPERSRLSNAALRGARQRHAARPTEAGVRVERPAGEPRPVMLLASNGVGIGHVSRLLSVARRLDPDVPVVFVTQAQAVGVIERLGYLAEYIPSASYIGGSFAAWDGWFRFELEQLIDAYDPALVVYDGNNPSHGLVQAVAAREDCRLAWMRRGLWGNTTSEFLDNSRWFDLILEPGELEGQIDEGVTAKLRHEVKMVPPIRLLDSAELLPKAAAAKALDLDPARPAVLIQLGAGYNRDVVSLIDQLVEELQKFPQLQICVAEWVNGAHSLNYWPDVKYLRGFPLSQYFKAFDFSIAAAGYNTFHELISFGIPTIFIPNRHPSMDDQAGRAVHAQDLHAAFELEEEDLADLPELVTLLMDAKAREFLSQNCRGLRRPNGAREAAQSLTELARAAL
jgi:UDP:flavonoid glycosyltransferase YjiC (YdhE family)